MLRLDIIKRLIIESKENIFISTIVKQKILVVFVTSNHQYEFDAYVDKHDLVIKNHVSIVDK